MFVIDDARTRLRMRRKSRQAKQRRFAISSCANVTTEKKS
jgi:hypothetical protein